MKIKTEIKIKGLLDKKRMVWFEFITISSAGNNAILTVEIKDESHLHGILNQIRDLNLKLISVNPAENNITK